MNKEKGEQSDCTANWSFAWTGSKRWVPLMPDMNATYWYYAIRLPRDTTIGFELHGQFGHTRYQNIIVYNDFTGDLIWGHDKEHKSSLTDVETIPDAGSENPFLPGVNRNTTNRNYTLWIVPEGSDTSAYSNFITYRQDDETFPCDDVEFPCDEIWISFYLRVYLPDQYLKGTPNYLSGGVPLPSIKAFDTRTNEAVACPPTRLIPGLGNMPDSPGPNANGAVHFYRVTAADYYPNTDNAYLASIFTEMRDSVAVIRVKPLIHTDTSDPNDVTPEKTEVRYWSFNVYGAKLTNVTACLADYEAKVSEDGFVYLVLGRHAPLIQHKVKEKGLNFLPWGAAHETIVLVYRHLVPNFEQSAEQVPIFVSGLPRESQAADLFIGDYAPCGVYCSEAEFLKGSYNFAACEHK